MALIELLQLGVTGGVSFVMCVAAAADVREEGGIAPIARSMNAPRQKDV